MRGWTGAQYSLWRIAVAVYLGSHELLLGLICLPIALGWYTRIWWAVLAVYWAFGFWWVPPGGMMMAGLIAAQLFVPDRPYLSLSRRGKPDPGTDWRMPRIAFAIALLSPLLELARTVPIPRTDMFIAAILFTALFVIPPAVVIGARRAPAPDKILYDGHCALCHGFVRFVLAEDQDGTRFQFAPLESSESADTVIVRTGAGSELTRYRAVRYVLERLGGYWRVIALGMRIVPTGTGDKMYDWIADHRYRIFGKKEDVCPVMPPALRPRFDL